MVVFVFGLVAVSFFLVIILGVFDKCINWEGVIVGMVVGLLFIIIYIVGVKFVGMLIWFFGVFVEGIGIVGMVLNFVVIFIVFWMIFFLFLEI